MGTTDKDPVVVVVELGGGNDYLNTVIRNRCNYSIYVGGVSAKPSGNTMCTFKLSKPVFIVSLSIFCNHG